MEYLHLWSPAILIILGGFISYFQYSLLTLFYDVYKETKEDEVKTLVISFSLLISSSILLIIFNVYAYYQLYTVGYGYMELYRRIGIFIYEALLALGFLFLILLYFKEIRFEKAILPTIILVQPLLDELDTPQLIINIIIIFETIILLILYFRRGSKSMLSGRLWMFSIIMIMLSRFVNSLPMKPISDIFSIFMDLIAFISLYLMKLELSFSLEGE